jgi:hypothetical protein
MMDALFYTNSDQSPRAREKCEKCESEGLKRLSHTPAAMMQHDHLDQENARGPGAGCALLRNPCFFASSILEMATETEPLSNTFVCK